MVLLLVGLLLLYLLRGLVWHILVLLVQVIGIVVAIVLIIVGLGLLFGGRWRRGVWRRYVVET